MTKEVLVPDQIGQIASKKGMLATWLIPIIALTSIAALIASKLLHQEMKTMSWIEDRTDLNALKSELLARTDCPVTLASNNCVSGLWQDVALVFSGNSGQVDPGAKRGRWNIKPQCRTNTATRELRILIGQYATNGTVAKDHLSGKSYVYRDMFARDATTSDNPAPGTPCNGGLTIIAQCENLGGVWDGVENKCRFDGLRRIDATDYTAPDLEVVSCLYEIPPTPEYPSGRTKEGVCRSITDECYDDVTGDLLPELKTPSDTSRKCKNRRRVCYYDDTSISWVQRKTDGTLRLCNRGVIVSN